MARFTGFSFSSRHRRVPWTTTLALLLIAGVASRQPCVAQDRTVVREHRELAIALGKRLHSEYPDICDHRLNVVLGMDVSGSMVANGCRRLFLDALGDLLDEDGFFRPGDAFSVVPFHYAVLRGRVRRRNYPTDPWRGLVDLKKWLENDPTEGKR